MADLFGATGLVSGYHVAVIEPANEEEIMIIDVNKAERQSLTSG